MDESDSWKNWFRAKRGPADVTIVMSEDRDSDVWRASVIQTRNYARKHNYSFYFHDTGPVTINPSQHPISYYRPLDDSGPGWVDTDVDALANTGMKEAFHVEDGYSFFFYNTWLTVFNPDRSRMKAFERERQPFGIVPEPICKVSAALEAARLSPEGSWLWIVDTDVIIMDMDQDLSGLIHYLEERGADASWCDWEGCGDGTNTGSIFIRNNEWGRSFLLRLRDARIVWNMFYVAEQGFVWVLEDKDVDVRKSVLQAPPRTFNPRHPEAYHTSDRRLFNRVFYHHGDFVVHLAGMPRERREELAKQLLAMTDAWPCQGTETASFQIQRCPQPIGFTAGNKCQLLVVNASLGSTERERWGRIAREYDVQMRTEPAFFPDGGFTDSAYAGAVNLNDTEDDSVFPVQNGWNMVAAARYALRSREYAWIFVCDGIDPSLCLRQFQTMRSVRNEDSFLLAGKDFGWPWLIRNGEASRTLLRRVCDCRLTRSARRELKDHALDVTDTEVASDALRLMVERDPEVKALCRQNVVIQPG